MDIIIPGKAAAPEQAADAIIKGIFGNGLPTSARRIAREALIAALRAWRDQLVESKASEVEELKTQLTDMRGRAEMAELKIAVMEKDR